MAMFEIFPKQFFSFTYQSLQLILEFWHPFSEYKRKIHRPGDFHCKINILQCDKKYYWNKVFFELWNGNSANFFRTQCNLFADFRFYEIDIMLIGMDVIYTPSTFHHFPPLFTTYHHFSALFCCCKITSPKSWDKDAIVV